MKTALSALLAKGSPAKEDGEDRGRHSEAPRTMLREEDEKRGAVVITWGILGRNKGRQGGFVRWK